MSLAVSLGQPAAAAATEHLAAHQAQHLQPPTAQEVKILLVLHAQRVATSGRGRGRGEGGQPQLAGGGVAQTLVGWGPGRSAGCDGVSRIRLREGGGKRRIKRLRWNHMQGPSACSPQ